MGKGLKHQPPRVRRMPRSNIWPGIRVRGGRPLIGHAALSYALVVVKPKRRLDMRGTLGATAEGVAIRDHELLRDRRGLSTLEYSLVFVLIVIGAIALPLERVSRGTHHTLKHRMTTLCLRLYAETSADEALQLAERLKQSLQVMVARVRVVAVRQYWKIPSYQELQLDIGVFGDAALALTLVSAHLGTGWAQQSETDTIWNQGEGSTFTDARVRWAHVEVID